jgi:membrane protein required for beta-lactamase induction
MALTGLAEAAREIRERVGPNARYSSFVSPREHHTPALQPRPRRRLERLLWTASLVVVVIVLLLAVLVALGF